MTQTTLNFQRQQAQASATAADSAAVMKALCVGDWMTGRLLCSYLGWPDCEASRRKLRKIAEANRDKLLTGDKGYLLLSSATMDEVRHAYNRQMAQARKMEAGAVKLIAAYHRFGHVKDAQAS